jgi:hypothetical protein
MDDISIDRLVLEVPGVSASDAAQLARQVGAGLAAGAAAGNAGDFDMLAVRLDGLAPGRDLPRLAAEIVDQLLRQIG